MVTSRHPALQAASEAAIEAWTRAVSTGGRDHLLEAVAEGADGTPTSRLDALVESAILEAVDHLDVNILSEEIGHLDRGSSTTLVIDPVDGTGNASAGIPFSAFTGAIAVEERFVEGLTHWFDTGRQWWAHVDEPTGLRTTGRQRLDGAIVSMIRPKGDGAGFLSVARRTDRVRVLGSSSIEAALVADGVLDAAFDPGSRTHRIVDLAAAVVLVCRAGGVVVDVHGRPLTFTTDIAGRWSGVAAASQELADEIVELLRGTA
mgnify:CR=1 FL=1|jgi:myo-inositol-1(or 4)-monophosphatase